MGIIPKNTDLVLDSRHLGLISTMKEKSLQKKIHKTSRIIADSLDIEKIIRTC